MGIVVHVRSGVIWMVVRIGHGKRRILREVGGC
jgi:hypothetical protein